jgi:hypothetical protein
VFAKVTDARCEAEAEQMAQAEDVIEGSGGMCRMLADCDPALMAEQPVDDMRSLAGIGGYDLPRTRRYPLNALSLRQIEGRAAQRRATAARSAKVEINPLFRQEQLIENYLGP